MTMVAGVLLTLPALFLTSAFFPEPLLPDWLQTVARANPASCVIETGQRLMSTGNDWGQDIRTLIALAVAAVALVPASSPRSGPRRDDDPCYLKEIIMSGWVVLAFLIVLNVAALLWGRDSRDGRD